MGKLVEGVWDCTHCGSKAIKARYKKCPGCGASQDEDTKFRLPSEITYVPEAEAEQISREPDWQCSYCGQLNKDTDTNCEGCGASKEDSDYNYFELQEKNKVNDIQSEHINELKEESKIRATENPVSALVKRYGVIALSIIVGVLFVVGLVALLSPKVKTVTVDEVAWRYDVDVEEYKTFTESGWSLPTNARLLRSTQEIKYYEQVVDHYVTVTKTKSRQVIDYYEEVIVGYKDLGNGYFEEKVEKKPVYKTEYYTVTEKEPVYRQEPVYATKYYYEIDRWTKIDTITTTGTDKEPYYGETELKSNQRYGSKLHIYMMYCTDKDGNTENYTINHDDWLVIYPGDTLEITYTVFNTVTNIKKIEQTAVSK